ncbi:MAG: tetratricopeptide repeat protein [Clostridiaceae bacterium]|nr:tetratricopeptide repeat protein [Clostridiaceae bacterium]
MDAQKNKNKNNKIILIVLVIFMFSSIGVFTAQAVQNSKVTKFITTGNKFLLEGKYDQAILEFQEALKINSKNVEARIGLAKGYSALKKYDKSIEVLKEGIRLTSKETKLYLMLSDIYMTQGTTEEAIKVLTDGYEKTKNQEIKKKLDEIKSSISILLEKSPLQVGNTTTVRLVQNDKQGNLVKVLNAEWKVKVSKVGIINKIDATNAEYKGKAKGNDEVIASIGKSEFTKSIEVKDKVLQKLVITGGSEATVGDTGNFKVTGYDQMGSIMEVNSTWDINVDIANLAKTEGQVANVNYVKAGGFILTASVGDIKEKVNVTVQKRKYKVGTTVSGKGSINQNPKASDYEEDTKITLTAIPEKGWHFANWYGSATGTANSIELLVNGNKDVKAVYQINHYTLKTEVFGQGDIARSVNKGTYEYKTLVKLTATARTGYRFDHWEGAVSSKNPVVNVEMSGNKLLKAVFVKNQYTLQVEVAGKGKVNRTSNNSTYAYGTNVQLTAEPEAGYKFDGWEGDANGKDVSVTIKMDKSKKVKAVFIPNDSKLSVEVVGHGSIKQENVIGNKMKLTAVPSDKSIFSHWEGDLSGTSNSVEITLDKNKTVKAVFIDMIKVNGKIMNSKNQNGVATAVVNIRTNKDNKVGQIYKTLESNALGQYEVALLKGEYTFEIIKGGFTTEYVNVTVGNTDMIKDLVLNEIDNQAKYRIVLTWGANPNDLDSHLMVPTNGGSSHNEVYYGKSEILDSNGNPMVKLDTDDMNGYGPETTTILSMNIGKYTYYVRDFSNTGKINNSNAIVKVYKNNILVNTFDVPTTTEGVGNKDNWHVFNIVNDEVVPVNKILDNTPQY